MSGTTPGRGSRTGIAVAGPWRPSRRGIVGGGAALAATAVLPLGSGRLVAATRTHSFKVGEAEITILSDGVFTLPASFVLPGTEPATAEALLKAQGGRALFVGETNVTVVRLGQVLALVDTGAGSDFMPTLGRMPDALEGLGIGPDAVTHVIFTHAHADHFWGVVDPFGDGSRWPGARHVMPRAERDFWLKPGVEDTVPEAMKGMAIGITRRLEALSESIATFEGNAEIAPGLHVFATPGHTPGHASVAIRSGGEEVVVGGDALTHAAVSFQEPGLRWGSDFDWQQAAATRKSLLDRLTQSKARLVGFHLPWPGVGRVERQGTAYRFVAG